MGPIRPEFPPTYTLSNVSIAFGIVPLTLGHAWIILCSQDMTGLFVIVLIVVAPWAGSIVMKDR